MDDAEAAYFRAIATLARSGDEAGVAKEIRFAAERGYAPAQLHLGRMYHRGGGVPLDFAEAAVWFRRAADQGEAGAYYDLGVMYATGRGVPQDNVQAHMYYNLAAANYPPGYDRDFAVEIRDSVESKMTAAQIGEAQNLARQFKPKPER